MNNQNNEIAKNYYNKINEMFRDINNSNIKQRPTIVHLVNLLLDVDTFSEEIKNTKNMSIIEINEIYNEYEKILKNNILSKEHFTDRHITNTTNVLEFVKRTLRTFKATSGFVYFNENKEIKSFWEKDDSETEIDVEKAEYETMAMIENGDVIDGIIEILMKNKHEGKITIDNYFLESEQAIGVDEELNFVKTKSVSLYLKINPEEENQSGIQLITFYPDLYKNSEKINYNLNSTIAKALSEEAYEPNRMFWLIRKACVEFAANSKYKYNKNAFRCIPYFTSGTENLEYKKIDHIVINIPNNKSGEIYKILIKQNEKSENKESDFDDIRLLIGTKDSENKFILNTAKCGENGLALTKNNNTSLIKTLYHKGMIDERYKTIQKIVDIINESKNVYLEKDILKFLNDCETGEIFKNSKDKNDIFDMNKNKYQNNSHDER